MAEIKKAVFNASQGPARGNGNTSFGWEFQLADNLGLRQVVPEFWPRIESHGLPLLNLGKKIDKPQRFPCSREVAASSRKCGRCGLPVCDFPLWEKSARSIRAIFFGFWEAKRHLQSLSRLGSKTLLIISHNVKMRLIISSLKFRPAPR